MPTIVATAIRLYPANAKTVLVLLILRTIDLGRHCLELGDRIAVFLFHSFRQSRSDFAR